MTLTGPVDSRNVEMSTVCDSFAPTDKPSTSNDVPELLILPHEDVCVSIENRKSVADSADPLCSTPMTMDTTTSTDDEEPGPSVYELDSSNSPHVRESGSLEDEQPMTNLGEPIGPTRLMGTSNESPSASNFELEVSTSPDGDVSPSLKRGKSMTDSAEPLCSRLRSCGKDRQSKRHEKLLYWLDNPSADSVTYRNHYADALPSEDPDLCKNMEFYFNSLRNSSRCYIDEFLVTKFGAYDFLEYSHNFIQWLFPIREQGLDYRIHPLQKHEMTTMLADENIQKRLIRAYELMLDFYGFHLNAHTGEVDRSSRWKVRLRNLNNHQHNFMRISRILKCLGELGLPNYQLPFITRLVIEVFVERTIPNAEYSLLKYWVHLIRDEDKRSMLLSNVRLTILKT